MRLMQPSIQNPNSGARLRQGGPGPEAPWRLALRGLGCVKVRALAEGS